MKTKILIVDDELLVRKALSRLFTNNGYQVLEAADGQEGYELWLEHRPDYSFVDVMMPKLTGPELIKKIKAQGLATQNTYLMSAFNKDHDMPLPEEIAGFIAKPFDNLFGLKDLIKG